MYQVPYNKRVIYPSNPVYTARSDAVTLLISTHPLRLSHFTSASRCDLETHSRCGFVYVFSWIIAPSCVSIERGTRRWIAYTCIQRVSVIHVRFEYREREDLYIPMARDESWFFSFKLMYHRILSYL